MFLYAALFGRVSRSPFDIIMPEATVKDSEMRIGLRNAQMRFEVLRQRLVEANIVMKRSQHEKGKDALIAVGDWVYNKINVRNELNYKLGRKFGGPHEVVEVINPNKFLLESNEGKRFTVHRNQVKQMEVGRGRARSVTFAPGVTYCHT